jgi:hypothetical protein
VVKGIQESNLGKFKYFLDDTQNRFPSIVATLENLCDNYKDNMPKMSSTNSDINGYLKKEACQKMCYYSGV